MKFLEKKNIALIIILIVYSYIVRNYNKVVLPVMGFSFLTISIIVIRKICERSR